MQITDYSDEYLVSLRAILHQVHVDYRFQLVILRLAWVANFMSKYMYAKELLRVFLSEMHACDCQAKKRVRALQSLHFMTDV